MVEIDDEDLAVADLAGFCRGGDGIDGLVDLLGGDREFDLDLGQETEGVFGAAIGFRMNLLPGVSFGFRNREIVDVNGGQGVPDLYELEWLVDGYNDFHRS